MFRGIRNSITIWWLNRTLDLKADEPSAEEDSLTEGLKELRKRVSHLRDIERKEKERAKLQKFQDKLQEKYKKYTEPLE